MAYLNTNELDQYYGLIPGDSVPVELRTWPSSVRDGFVQVPRVEGNLSDTPYSLRSPNSQGISVDFGGNGLANLPGFNIFNPIATTFNTEIITEGGGGGGSGVVESVTVTSNPASPAYLSVSGTAAVPLITFNASSLPTAAHGFGEIAADSGTSANASGPDQKFSITTADDFISSTVSGSSSTSKVELAFTKNLYTTFSTGGNGTCTPGSLTADLGIEGINGVTTAGNNTKIDVALDDTTAPSEWYAYGTVVTTSSPISGSDTVTTHNAGSVGDTLSIKNTATAIENSAIDPNVAKSVLQIKSSANDTIDLEINPIGYAGFGAQLVKITGDPQSGGINGSISGLGEYSRYVCTAYFFDGTASGNPSKPDAGGSQTNKTLLDFSTNKDRTTAELIKDSPGGTTTSSLRWPADTILLAQRVSADIYVTSHMPRLEVDCDGS